MGGTQREMHNCQLANLETQKEILKESQKEAMECLNKMNRENQLEVTKSVMQRLDDLRNNFDSAATALEREKHLTDQLDSIRDAVDQASKKSAAADEASKELLRAHAQEQFQEISKIKT